MVFYVKTKSNIKNKIRPAYFRLAAFLLLLLLVVFLNHRYGWSRLLADPAQLPLLRNQLQQNFGFALLIYIGITVVGCVLLALPGLVFALAAGLLFGPFWGTLACSCATTIGAALAFVAGRFFLRDALTPWIMRNKKLSRLLFEQAGQKDIYVLMITRLLPIFPYNLQNFAYGITNIRFWPYTIYSFLFMLPGAAVYAVAAAGFADPQKRLTYWLIAAVLLLMVILAALLLHPRLNRQEKGKGAEA